MEEIKKDMLTMRGFCAVYDGFLQRGYTSLKAYELTEIEFQQRHNTQTTKFSSLESFKVCRSKKKKKHGRI